MINQIFRLLKDENIEVHIEYKSGALIAHHLNYYESFICILVHKKSYNKCKESFQDVFETFKTYKRRFLDIHNVQKSPPKDQMTSVETTIATLTKILITYKKHSKDLSYVILT